jgi:hypothetical protein
VAASIRELKRNHRTLLALGRSLPTHDRGIPLPFSTGHPLFDAALTDKIVATSTLNEPEHLSRAWHLVTTSSAGDRARLAASASLLLNDYKSLLALHCLDRGEDEAVQAFLRALPWGSKLGFAALAIKPATRVFTGWRRTLRFRLVNEPPFERLRAIFRELLAAAPPVAILKYRSTIKESAALLRYRFEGERERAIHCLVFENGAGLGDDVLPPIGTYVAARKALASGVEPFLSVLERADHPIPITSFMGLLGNARLALVDPYLAERFALQNYAIACATPVESLLRLAEWGPWLTETHAADLARTVRHGVIERGVDVPFFKVLKAFMAAPPAVRKMLVEPLLAPLMKHFGAKIAGLLPEPGPMTYLQPGNVIHLTSFLLYAVLASAMKTRMLLLYKNGVEEIAPFDLDVVTSHLADDRESLERWLLSELGGLTSVNEHVYDFPALAKRLGTLDPRAPLLLDLPFAESPDVLAGLLPFERVFNLSNPFGAPGEICVAYEYYAKLWMGTPAWSYGVWSRVSDSAAPKFAELLDRLKAFQTLGAAS